MIARTHNSLYDRERMLFMTVVSCLMVTIASYMYFLSATVVHVVMRKEVDKEISTLSSSVGSLEAEYIEIQHSVSEDIASLKGFSKTDAKIFIDKTESTLSLRNN